ncbi:MaoC family dehydratase [Bdellovibrio sp. NC01]|uniref:MaoC family dehydratase n=1 Tax=Bdellovibrio sp. NC01 TaxID=2220073 RepID=UPI0011578261|nr:MaoC family dehydratase [Bdellovibrio sp. NC01]QDK36773.1 protein dehydratase [Bdellovibrio sp. NC01]
MAANKNIDVGFTSSVTVKVTDKMVHQFAELSGDHNPIHLDDAYAAKTRFGRRIAHGMISGALISRALVECIGGGGVYLGQSLKFVNPVFIDDTITITIKITAVRKEKGIATVETNVTKDNGDMVVKGEAVIMVGRDMEHA